MPHDRWSIYYTNIILDYIRDYDYILSTRNVNLRELKYRLQRILLKGKLQYIWKNIDFDNFLFKVKFSGFLLKGHWLPT